MAAHLSHYDPDHLGLFLDEQLSDEAETELDRHLETCQTCRRKLESMAAEPSWWSEAREHLGSQPPTDVHPANEPECFTDEKPAALSKEDTPTLDFLAPTDDPTKLGRLGPYEISGVIGCGGMGVVLKGFDPALSRTVAIKVLAPQLAAVGAARQRFAREARATAAVDHEHVVAIHAVASVRGFPYFVMPLVRGESLQRRIDRTGTLELKEILRIGRQIAAGLAAAHAQGLVHRDVKPGNILLEDGVERVMITDFGLARAVDDASMTVSGVLAGTPQYMAPEQAKGEPVDHRSDLFSLGCAMYAMCTGRSPFRAETTMAVLRRVCEEPPRPIREINPDIPEWLTEIIEKLYAKRPAERFQSAAEVAELLGKHLAHLQQPSVVPMPDRLPRHRPAVPVWRTRRGRKTIAAVLLLLLIGGFTTTETLQITHVAQFFAGRSEPHQPTPPQPPVKQRAAEPQIILVTPEMVNWDDGLKQQIEQLQWEIGDMRADLIQQSSYDQPVQPHPDPERPNENAKQDTNRHSP
ncbi:MAG: protein kinase domain-containing protein [Planctomycetota bacterium]|jgi:serine/threonine-protein kinase